jgi:gliding motility-associated-like protein
MKNFLCCLKIVVLIIIIVFANSSKSFAQASPQIALSTISSQWGLSGYQNYLFTITLSNPPLDTNGNYPQGVELSLYVYYGQTNNMSNPTLIGSNYWGGANTFSSSTFTPNNIPASLNISSAILPMYNNSIASCGFVISDFLGTRCPKDTFWYEVRAKYFSDTNNINSTISWMQNGASTTENISNQVGFNNAPSTKTVTESCDTIMCKNTTLIEKFNFNQATYPFANIDSIQVQFYNLNNINFVSLTAQFNTYYNPSFTIYNFSGSYFNANLAPVTNFVGNASWSVSLKIYTCGQLNAMLIYNKNVQVYSCIPIVYDWLPKVDGDIYRCPTLCDSSSFVLIDFLKTNQNFTSPLVTEIMVSDINYLHKIDFNFIYPSSYTITALNTACNSITGSINGGYLNTMPIYNCGNTAIKIRIKSDSAFYAGSGSIFLYLVPSSNAINLPISDSIFVRTFDTNNAMIGIDTGFINYYNCCAQAASYALVANNSFQHTVGTPGQLKDMACWLSFPAKIHESFITKRYRLKIELPPTWTIDIFSKIGEIGVENILTTVPNNFNMVLYGSTSNYFKSIGLSEIPIHIGAFFDSIIIDSLTYTEACSLDSALLFKYTIRIPYGAAQGNYYINATLDDYSGVACAYNQSAEVTVLPYTQVYASMKAKCSETFYTDQLNVDTSSTNLNYMGEIINLGNTDLKYLSIFNAEPMSATNSNQDLQYANCNNALRGSQFNLNNYGLNATMPVSTFPSWTSSNLYTHTNSAILPAMPCATVSPIGGTNFGAVCNNTLNGVGGLSAGSILINSKGNYLIQPLDRLQFFTKSLTHNGLIGDTSFNNFSYTLTRLDLNLPIGVVISNTCSTKVVIDSLSHCPGCDYMIVSDGCNGKPLIKVKNLSYKFVSKLIFYFTDSCTGFTTVVNFDIPLLLPPDSTITIPYYALPVVPAGCVVTINTTMFSQLFEGTNQFLDSCSSGLPIKYTGIPILQLSDSISPIICHNGTGSIICNASGGVPAYTYSFQGGVFNAISNFFNLQSNVYSVRVQDAKGCMVKNIINLYNPDSLHIRLDSLKNSTCTSLPNGKIYFKIMGGKAPYTSVINPGNISISGNLNYAFLSANNYTLVTTDSLGCTTQLLFTITQPDTLKLSNIATAPTCLLGNNGIICASVTGGYAPYAYSLNNITNSNNCFNNLQCNNYTLIVSDSVGCIDSIHTTLYPIINPVVFANILVQNNLCFGDSMGSILVKCKNGTSITNSNNYIFNIVGAGTPINNAITNADSAKYTNLLVGNYTIVATDANGCSTITTVAVLQPTQLYFNNIIATPPPCLGDSNGTILISVKGGLGKYLSTCVPKYPTATNALLYTRLWPQNYVITISDSLGCTLDTIINIASTTKFSIDTIAITNTKCSNSNFGSLAIFAKGGSGAYKYSIQPSGFVNSTGLFQNLDTGKYLIAVQDSFGCIVDTNLAIIVGSDSLNIDVIVNEKIECDQAITTGNAEIITHLSGTAPYKYAWSFNSNLDSALANNLQVGVYTVTVSDAQLCSQSKSFSIQNLICCSPPQFPNVFSPNNDLINENFGPLNLNKIRIQLLKFEIYDRWGNLVFSTLNLEEKWNGKYFNNQNAELGAYMYLYKYLCKDNNEVNVVKGDVLLMR